MANGESRSVTVIPGPTNGHRILLLESRSTARDTGKWRKMRSRDLHAVQAMADVIHRDHPEDSKGFAERLRLHPEGCLVFERGDDLEGYVISHPWTAACPPPLNTSLGALPEQPTSYYIHDLALLPDARGLGAASVVVEMLIDHARSLGLSNVSLVAVGGSTGFWRASGFAPVRDPTLAPKLRSYGKASFMVRAVPSNP
jgi:ribosomal protein S18 acetylase RimI-like enzyme